jgi:gluconokinase
MKPAGYHKSVNENHCRVIVMVGVMGSGKSTVGKLLARQLGWRFIEGDDFHPPSNIQKIRSGVALTDSDRLPWLQSVKAAIVEALNRGESAVIACSALKKSYRDILRTNGEVKFVYLKARLSLIKARLRQRRHHFMNPALIRSQFDTLEEPKKALQVDAGLPLTHTVELIRRA